MGLLRFFKKQLATVIEWQPQPDDLLLWKYPAPTDEIKNASQLIVSPGQGCILVYEGKITDMLDQEGTYSIRTDNHPFITTLRKVSQFFESEHKMGLYFFRKAEVVNQGWGTSSPIKYVDKVYNIPIQLSAYGNFSYRLTDASKFFSEYTGLTDVYPTASFRDMMQSRIPQVLVSYLSHASMAYTEIDAALQTIAKDVTIELDQEFQRLGITLVDFRIQGNSFDQATQTRIGRIADISADTLAAKEGGLTFVELEKLRALRDAAQNEGGMAGAGVGLGAGMSMGKLFTEQIDAVAQPEADRNGIEHFRKLKLLLDEKLISQEEYDRKRAEYLNKL